MPVLVLPVTEKQILNNLIVPASSSSSWVEALYSTPVSSTTIMLDCVATNANLLCEMSLDGSKWLALNPNPPVYIDFGYSPTPFGADWNRPAGAIVCINQIVHKRLRFKIENNDATSVTANLWMLGALL